MLKHNLTMDEFELDEIASIEEMDCEETIDITVEDTHMFFLENGIYTHNSGLNAEVITMESISEAFNKCFVADFIFSISRTAEDKLANTGRIFVAKNRNCPDGLIFPIHMDTSNVTIDVQASTGETIGEVKKEAKKRQEKKLIRLYKKTKKDGGK